MSDTPELVVYETFIAGDGHPGLRTRDATVPEVVAWLREQGAIDYEAGASVVRELLDRVPPDLDDQVCMDSTVWALAIVDAALPGEV